MIKGSDTLGSQIDEALFEAMQGWDENPYGDDDYAGILAGGASPAPQYQAPEVQVTVMERHQM